MGPVTQRIGAPLGEQGPRWYNGPREMLMRHGLPSSTTLRVSLLLSLGMPAAGCTVQAQIADLMHDSWQIVREYEQAGYTYYVVREGPRFAKIVQLPSGPVYTLYGVDTLTRTCKWEDIAIDCARLRADPDLGPVITWSEAPVTGPTVPLVTGVAPPSAAPRPTEGPAAPPAPAPY